MAREPMPIIAHYEADRLFAWRGSEAVSCGHALADIQALAARLTPGRAYFNLCDDRYAFTVAFAAVCLAGGVNLLPASRAESALAGVRQRFPEAGTLDDGELSDGPAPDGPGGPPRTVPAIDGDHCAAIVFTSGSTGPPTAHRKFWRDLQISTDLWLDRFFPHAGPLNIMATVPPQHMYGLETSVLAMLQAGFAAHAGRPSMPWEIAEALTEVPAPRVLITTPVHLRACLQAGVVMPELRLVISATAPLSAETAQAAEQAWQAPVHEIYGCTEAGSLASRRATESEVWTLYQGMWLTASDTFLLRGPQLPEAIALSDRLTLLDAYRFRLLGRSRDMLKLAGKRLSLGELNQRLLAVEGVVDAAAFVPGKEQEGQRPAALVVAPGLAEQDIAARLAAAVDPVFVPRPLLRVDVLPRNSVGKLPQAALEAALEQHRAAR